MLQDLNNKPSGMQIRLKYSMSIIYAGRLLSLFSNALFVIMLARKLTVTEFSAWVILSKVITYFILFTSTYVFWSVRAISRGWNVSKATVIFSVTLGSIALIIAELFIYHLAITFNYMLFPLLIGGLTIFEEYLNRGLLAISQGYKPHHLGVHTAIMALSRLGLGYILLVVYPYGLLGAVSALVFSRALGIAYLFMVNKEILSLPNEKIGIIKIWLKRSWYPLLDSLSRTLIALDAIIVRYLTGSDLAIAYYGIAIMILNVVAPPAQMFQALSSKLLAKVDTRYIDDALWMYSLFVFPVATTVIAFAAPISAIFSIKYMPVAQIIKVFSLVAIVYSLFTFSQTTLLSLEKIDYNPYQDFSIKNTVFADALKINFLSIVIYLITLIGISLIIRDPILIVMLWGVAYAIRATIGITGFSIIALRKFGVKMFNFSFLKVAIKFATLSVVFLLIGLIYPIKISERFYVMLASILPPLAISLVLYAFLVLLFDKKARMLLKILIRHIKRLVF